MFCRQCGAPLREDAEYCAKCGAPVKGQTPSESPQKRAGTNGRGQTQTEPALKPINGWGIAGCICAVISLQVALQQFYTFIQASSSSTSVSLFVYTFIFILPVLFMGVGFSGAGVAIRGRMRMNGFAYTGLATGCAAVLFYIVNLFMAIFA